MSQKTAKIADVINGINNNEYLIPAFQRKFTWKTEQIEALFDSIMRGYPISTFLLYEPDDTKVIRNTPYLKPYIFFKHYDSEKNYNDALDEKQELHRTAKLVLDGQQRLTALNIGLQGSYEKKKLGKGHRKTHIFHLYLDVANFKNDHDDENTTYKYDFKFLTEEEAQHKTAHNKLWVKVSDMYDGLVNKKTNIAKLSVKCSQSLSSRDTISEDDKNKIDDTIADIISDFSEKFITNEIIASYSEKTSSLEDLKDIFIRINSGGVSLSKIDLLMTTIELYWAENKEDNARDTIDKLSKEIEDTGYRISKDTILRSALIAVCDISEFKPESFHKNSVEDIKKNWDKVRSIWLDIADKMKKNNIRNQDIFSYNALIPVFHFHYSNDKAETNIKEWLIIADAMDIFSGASNTVLSTYRTIIKGLDKNIKKLPMRQLIERQDKDFPNADNIIENLSYGDKGTRLLLSLLQDKQSQQNIEYEVDHIYSKTIAHKNGIDASKYNALENLALLNDRSNREKQASNPAQYYNNSTLKEFAILPDIDATWDNFDRFLVARKAKLIQLLNEKMLCLNDACIKKDLAA